MIPVFCHEKHQPSEGKYGDCLRACVASILEIEDIYKVPHFFRNGKNALEAWDELRSWSKSQGVYPFMTAFDGTDNVDDVCNAMAHANPDVYYLLFGKTDNNTGHVVVKINNETAHNPSWGGGMKITKPQDDGLWLVVVFVSAVLVKNGSSS